MTSVHVIRSHSFGKIVNKRHFVHRFVSWILSEKRSPNEKKTWEGLVPQEAKIRTKSQFRGNSKGKIWVSPIFLETKFGGSETNFRGKFWGQALDLLIWRYHPWDFDSRTSRTYDRESAFFCIITVIMS